MLMMSRTKRSSGGMGRWLRGLLVLAALATAAAGIMGDECDWTGSGLTLGASRVVTPVYLRCRAGRINWMYPRGALRVILRLHNSNKDFKVCVKVLTDSNDDYEDKEMDLYSEDEVLDFREGEYISAAAKQYYSNSVKSEDFPARLFLEGSRGLVPLYASDDGSDRTVRCFRSKNGQAAMYVEATPETGEMKRMARFQYDLKPLSAKAYDPSSEDCRPCNLQELAHAFCTSDIVMRGVIVGMQERNELDTSELTIRINRLIRYITPDSHTYTAETGAPHNNSSEYQKIKKLFLREDESRSNGAFGDSDTENQIGRSREKEWNRPDGQSWYAKIQTGAQCGATIGAGEFLITASRRLGMLALTCAPRTSEWDALVKKINDEGKAHCILSS